MSTLPRKRGQLDLPARGDAATGAAKAGEFAVVDPEGAMAQAEPLFGGRGRPGRRPRPLSHVTLAQIRREQKITQKQVASRLPLNQANISRLESRDDTMLSTLRAYVNALGGELDLVVRFGERSAVLVLEDTLGKKRPRRKPIVQAGSAHKNTGQNGKTFPTPPAAE